MYVRSERLELRLSVHDLEVLDAQRGNVSRSSWIRGLIHGAPREIVRSSPSPAPLGDDPRQPVIATVGRHHHRYERTGDPLRYHQGRPVYLHTCGCGDTKEE